AAMPLSLLLAGFAFQPPLFRRTRWFRRPARLRDHERPFHEIREPLECLAPIMLLRALIPRDNEDGPVVRQSAPSQHSQPILHGLRQRGTALHVEPQLYRRGDLVDVLAAWPRR